MKSEFQKMQEQLQPFMSSARQIYEMEKLLGRDAGLSHAKEMMAQLEPVLQSHKGLSNPRAWVEEAQAMLYGSTLAFQSQKLLEQYVPQNFFKITDEVSRMHSSAYSFAEAVEKQARLVEPITNQYSFVEKLYRQSFEASTFAENLVKQHEQTFAAITALREAKKSVDGILGQFRDMDLQINASGQDEREVETAVQAITQEADAHQSFEAAIKGIVAAILSQPNPTVQVILWLFFSKLIEMLISGAIGAVMGHYAPIVLGESPQANKKSIQEIAKVAVAW